MQYKMKKTVLFILGAFALSISSPAQIARHVLGLRFGSGDGFGTEISYQHGLSAVNRLEIDLGMNSHHENQPNGTFNYSSWGLTGLYHWVFKIENELNWYVGPGGKIGALYHEQGYEHNYQNGFFLVAAGDIGVDYSFPVGIQVALNARPEFGLINHGVNINVGLAVRYRFR
jgi:hypothetical protein